MPVCGNMAMKMTIMPKPPTQPVKLRHNSTLFGRLSMSASTVAPVPEKPDTDSVKASSKFM